VALTLDPAPHSPGFGACEEARPSAGTRIRNQSPAVIQIGSYMAIVWAMAGETGPAPAFTLEYDVQPQNVRELVVAMPRVKDKGNAPIAIAP
jgi:hypothetical protein